MNQESSKIAPEIEYFVEIALLLGLGAVVAREIPWFLLSYTVIVIFMFLDKIHRDNEEK